MINLRRVLLELCAPFVVGVYRPVVFYEPLPHLVDLSGPTVFLHERTCAVHSGLFVGWLLNVPETCECISGTDLRRQFYVLPH